jgi:hypothetical protein
MTLKSVKRLNGDRAALDLSGSLGVVGVIIGAVIVMIITANLFPTFVGAVEDVNDNLTSESVSFGDPTTDGIKDVFAIVIGLAALLGIVGLVLGAFRGRLGNGPS